MKDIEGGLISMCKIMEEYINEKTAEMSAIIAEKDEKLAEKDEKLAEKDEKIRQLEELLAKKNIDVSIE